MARKPLRPLIRSGGFYPSRKWTPLVYAGGYTTANGGEEPTPPPIEKTVTGNPIHITDALAKPVQALSVALEPIQDLHGYDNPWPAGGGKNLFDASTVTGSSATVTVSSNGKRIDIAASSGNYNCAEFDATSLVGKGDFYLSYYAERTSGSENAASCTGNYRLNGAYKYDGVSGNRAYVNDKVQVTDAVVNFPEGATNAVIKFYINNYSTLPTGGISGYFEDVRLCKEQSQPWTPYANLCPIYGHTDADVTRTGVNLNPHEGVNYTTETYPSGIFLKAGNYVFSTDNGEGFGYGKSIYVKLKDAGGNVVTKGNLSGDGWTLNSSETLYYGFGISGAHVAPFTLLKDCYVCFGFNNEIPTAFNNLMLNVGSTAEPYEAFVGTTLPVSWQSEAGTVYAGYLSIDKDGNVTLTGTHQFLTFDGSENWIEGSNYYALFSQPASVGNYDTSQIANWLKGGGNAYADDGNFRVQSNGAVCIGNKNGWIADVTALKTMLSDTPLQILYELATPATYTLSSVTVPSTVQGENNLWSDAGDMTLTYYADGNASEIEALNILLGNRYYNNHEADEPTDREALDILLGRTR